MDMIIEELHKEIERVWPKHLEETRRILRVPSVSMTGEGIQDTADMLEDFLDGMGAEHGQFRSTRKSHPLVHGHLDVGAEGTALVYGMYDVQPIGDLDEWDHPPFGATIVNQRPYGKVLVNRGAYNSKASLAGTLLAIRTMLEKDSLPVNVRFLLEGEEECGGRSLPDFVVKNKAVLSKANAALALDYCEDSRGVPQVCLGLKGCVYFDLIAEGKARGGPTAEVHSSEAVWMESPVWRLVHAISTMVDSDQQPTVDGLWDDVRGPDKEDVRMIKKLSKMFDPKSYLKDSGVERFKVKGSSEKLLEKYMFEPSVNIDGLISGFQEEGTKTVLPPSATAKIDIRIVPDMTIEGTRRKVMAHLRRRGFTDIRMRNYEDYPWSKIDAGTPIAMACIDAMRAHGKEPEVWPMIAGSAPFYVFDEVLGVPWGSAGLGRGGRAHSPNEFAVVEGMKRFEKSVVTIFWKLKEHAEAEG
ncbi:MAG: M20/M25/M40 family metallo-hydrolase [Candidatus Thermoplasmatota archaeon]|nr:M20/M25/M40 family metallo-hydrolase [Candidatus Thermoplasmatota archaeon]